MLLWAVKLKEVSDTDTVAAACVQVQTKGGDTKTTPSTTDGSETAINLSRLDDCLSCTSCAVSDDVVQMKTQTVEKLQEIIEDPEYDLVISLSPYSLAAIKKAFKSIDSTDVYSRVQYYLRKRGVKHVLDYGIATAIYKNEILRERRSRGTRSLISSNCPGISDYIKQTVPKLTSKLSAVPSQMMWQGLVVKAILPFIDEVHAFRTARRIQSHYYQRLVQLKSATHHQGDSRKIFHVAVEPCHDKKLEACQSTNKAEGMAAERFGPLVDMALTTQEFLSMLPADLPEPPNWFVPIPSIESMLEDIFPGLQGIDTHTVLRDMQSFPTGEFAQALVEEAPVRRRKGYNVDHIVWSTEEESSNRTVHSATGLRNIKAVATKYANSESVELLACPGGCLSGGVQASMVKGDELSFLTTREGGVVDLCERLLQDRISDTRKISEVQAASRNKNEQLRFAFHMAETTTTTTTAGI